MDPPALAEMLGVPVEHVRRMARAGLIPVTRCGRQMRFDPERIREWSERGGAGGWKRASWPHGARAGAQEVGG